MTGARISRGFAANVYDKLIIAVAQLAIVPILASHWGVQTYGAWVLLATTPSFLAISDFGFATAAGTQMTMLVAQGRRAEAVQVFQSAWAVILPSSLIVLATALLVCWSIPESALPHAASFRYSEVRETLALLIAYGLVSLQGSIFNAGFRCEGRFALGMFWAANTILIENTLLVLAVLSGAGPVIAATGLLCGRVFALIVQNVLLRRAVQWLRIGLSEARRETAHSLLKPAVAVMMLPLSQASFLQGTAIALGAAGGSAAVPAFTATRTLSRIGLQMTQLLVHAIMPEYSAAVARGDRVRQGSMLAVTIISAGLVLIPFAVFLAVCGPEFVAIWTRGKILVTRELMIVMAATVLFGGLWNPLSNLVLAMNRHAAYSYPFAVLAVLTIPASYVLSLRFGATGAAASIALLDAAMCIVILRLGHRLFVSPGEVIGSIKVLLAKVSRHSRV